MRHIFFSGRLRRHDAAGDGKLVPVFYSDMSGVDCDRFDEVARKEIKECECPSSDLELAPEDAEIHVGWRDKDDNWVKGPRKDAPKEAETF
jgi:hypothetical protein